MTWKTSETSKTCKTSDRSEKFSYKNEESGYMEDN